MKACPCCGSSELFKAYMLYPVFRGVYCDGCGEFIATWGIVINWLMEWFVAPFADSFPICVSSERAVTP